MPIIEHKLSYQARKKLPAGKFVFPKDRRYPIDDKNHARNALARVSQNGSSSEKAKVRSAVHRKYPDIGENLPLLAVRVVNHLLEHCGHCDEGDPNYEQCPVCGGDGQELGRLGHLMHYRCRQCGMDFSRDPRLHGGQETPPKACMTPPKADIMPGGSGAPVGDRTDIGLQGGGNM